VGLAGNEALAEEVEEREEEEEGARFFEMVVVWKETSGRCPIPAEGEEGETEEEEEGEKEEEEEGEVVGVVVVVGDIFC